MAGRPLRGILAGVARERQDLTRIPDLAATGSTAGPMREQRPVYVDLLPPCNVACPAGENIQASAAHVEAGRFEDAWRTDRRTTTRSRRSTAASATTRVRTSCNRAQLDSTVSIHSIERFLGDLATEPGWGSIGPSGPRPASAC